MKPVIKYNYTLVCLLHHVGGQSNLPVGHLSLVYPSPVHYIYIRFKYCHASVLTTGADAVSSVVMFSPARSIHVSGMSEGNWLSPAESISGMSEGNSWMIPVFLLFSSHNLTRVLWLILSNPRMMLLSNSSWMSSKRCHIG